MKILVTGSRMISLSDIEYIKSVLDEIINRNTDIIVHGGAYGVDTLVNLWCCNNDVTQEVIRSINPEKPQYFLHRNAEMVGMCDRCIAFWDKSSRGTKFTYDYAKSRGKPVKMFYI